jgi:hypothetical protein
MTQTKLPIEVELKFTSKDPLIAEYYESCFSDWFSRELIECLGPNFEPTDTFGVEDVFREVVGIWNRRMTLEAEIQEHYDYEEFNDESGKSRRFVIRDDKGQPQYLIPVITIVPKS